MRALTFAVVLAATLAHALDAGLKEGPAAGRPSAAARADAGQPDGRATARADARQPDAGSATKADAGVPARPVLVIAEDTATFDAFSTAKVAERARLKTTTVVKIGQVYPAAIFADGYTLPFSRVVDLSADLSITDSTGRVVRERASVAGVRTMDPKTMVAVQLVPDLRLSFGLTDPEGRYQVVLTLYDHVRGTATRTESAFTVTR